MHTDIDSFSNLSIVLLVATFLLYSVIKRNMNKDFISFLLFDRDKTKYLPKLMDNILEKELNLDSKAITIVYYLNFMQYKTNFLAHLLYLKPSNYSSKEYRIKTLENIKKMKTINALELIFIGIFISTLLTLILNITFAIYEVVMLFNAEGMQITIILIALLLMYIMLVIYQNTMISDLFNILLKSYMKPEELRVNKRDAQISYIVYLITDIISLDPSRINNQLANKFEKLAKDLDYEKKVVLIAEVTDLLNKFYIYSDFDVVDEIENKILNYNTTYKTINADENALVID